MWKAVQVAERLVLHRAVYFLLAALFLAACASREIIINGTAVPPVPTLDGANVELGAKVYFTHCAACHGGALEGQPNWKVRNAAGALPAPPHDSSGHTWHHPDEVLVYVIGNGGKAFDPNATMPAFGETLTEAEQQAVLDFIKSHWGRAEREHQWWVTATQNDAGVIPTDGK